MALTWSSKVLLACLMTLSLSTARSQVFVVGEKSATADIATDFTPTRVPLPSTEMTERGRRELVRNLDAEQGFAHRALPVGAVLTLHANGNMSPTPAEYRKLIYEKGQAAAVGDRVAITALDIKPDRIIIDFNGGPYAKHRILRHIQINDAVMAGDPAQQSTGTRITLLFEGKVPEISAPEVKALLFPLVDFGVKSTEEAYADTLPSLIKDAVAAHEVLVGMNHRMVLAAMGAPESKVRDQPSGDPNGARYEEWIYGHVPQTVRFVRFVGDRVTVVEIAALGKPIEIHDKDEMGGYNPPPLTHEIAYGDKTTDEDLHKQAAPSLRLPGETAPANSSGKVQFPTSPTNPQQPPPQAPAPASPTPVGSNAPDHDQFSSRPL